MRQLTFIEAGKLEWREVKAPRIEGPDEALIRPMAVTRCDLDLYFATGAFPMKGPFAFGHETAGEVVEVGDGVKDFAPGDRVIVPFQISCGVCDNCRRGWTNACTSVPAFSAYGMAPIAKHEWGGGLADLVHVPFASHMLVKAPDHVAWGAAAAISDNAVDGFRTVEGPLKDRPEADVLIAGGLGQSVGLFAVEAARAMGAGGVVYTDFDEMRLTLAKSLGADAVKIDYSAQKKFDREFPIVVEASGLPDGLSFALRSTEACGVCTAITGGVGGGPAKIPLMAMYTKGIEFRVSRVHARAVIPSLLDCMSCNGGMEVEKVITKTVPFDDAAEAMTDAAVKMVFLRDQ